MFVLEEDIDMIRNIEQFFNVWYMSIQSLNKQFCFVRKIKINLQVLLHNVNLVIKIDFNLNYQDVVISFFYLFNNYIIKVNLNYVYPLLK